MIPVSSGLASPATINNSVLKTPVFDFKTGDFVILDGKIVTADGIDAVKLYVEKVLRTQKGRYRVYEGTDFGVYIEDLIVGSNYPIAFVQSEMEREITEALLKNKDISAVSNFVFERTVNGLNVTFDVTTKNGESFEDGVIFNG